ncbi:MAG: MOSC domain-containing protein [Pseudomonadota bacterium]
MNEILKTIPQITRTRKLRASVDGLFVANGKTFVTEAVPNLELTFEGIPGDLHGGLTRKSGGREPWYKRGTEMRNERQLSIVCREELTTVARSMEIERIEPEWIGANVTLAGIPMFSMLPAGTLLFFENGATVKIDFQNGPCKFAGMEIANALGQPGDKQIAAGFPKHAKRRRGVVAWVEKPGTLQMGEAVKVQLPEQWIYPVDVDQTSV